MCSDDRFKEILKKSNINLSEQIEDEHKATIREAEEMSRRNDRLFRSILL